MAQLTLATAITQIRDWVQDGSTTAQGLTDAQLTRLVNNWYLWMYPQGEPRVTGQAAASTGITLSSTFVGTTTPTTYARILAVFASNSATAMTKPIKIVGLTEIYASLETTPAAVDPTQCAMFRKPDGAWFLIFDKSPTSQPISMLVEIEPTELTGSDAILLRPEETRAVARLAAVDAAMMLGRSQAVVDWLMAGVPEHFRQMLEMNAKALRPRAMAGRA